MTQREIDCGSYSLTKKDSSGHQCINVETGRRLTSGEKVMARTMFSDSLNYDDIYIYQGKFLPGIQGDRVAMAPNGHIYFPKDIYVIDFSLGTAEDQRLFIHEMTHIWQYQLDYNVIGHGLFEQIKNLINSSYSYELNPSNNLSHYNLEQQGAIISDYFSLRYANPLGVALSTSGRKVLNNAVGIVAARREYFNVIKDFFTDPSNDNNLPGNSL